MPKTATIGARVDAALKRDAESVFSRLGLTATEAITLFYAQVASRASLPFAVGIPNTHTEEALQEAETGENLVEYRSLDELRARFE